MPSNRIGRVSIESSSINVIAVGGVGAAPTNELITVSSDDFLGIRAGVNGTWAALQVVGHDQRPSELPEWEESMETAIRFTGPPFIFVDFAIGYGVEESLHDLKIPPGRYGVRVNAAGVSESFRSNTSPGLPLEQAPQPKELLQQFRIDMWPAEQ